MVIISIQNTVWAKDVTKTMTCIKDVSMCTVNKSLFAYRCAKMKYSECSLPILHVIHARKKRLTHTHTHTHKWILVKYNFVIHIATRNQIQGVSKTCTKLFMYNNTPLKNYWKWIFCGHKKNFVTRVDFGTRVWNVRSERRGILEFWEVSGKRQTRCVLGWLLTALQILSPITFEEFKEGVKNFGRNPWMEVSNFLNSAGWIVGTTSEISFL